jgi:hypothetical protein
VTAATDLDRARHQVGNADWLNALARVGLVAKGASFALVGILAIRLALLLRPCPRPAPPPTGAGLPAGESEPPELVVGDELLDQRKELSLLKPDVCVKQFPRRIQRLSIDDAGRHGDVEFASEPLELHVLDACLAEGRKSSSSSSRRWTRSSFLKSSTNSLAAASRAEASPSAAWEAASSSIPIAALQR